MIYVRPVGGPENTATLQILGKSPHKYFGVTPQTLTLTAPVDFLSSNYLGILLALNISSKYVGQDPFANRKTNPKGPKIEKNQDLLR